MTKTVFRLSYVASAIAVAVALSLPSLAGQTPAPTVVMKATPAAYAREGIYAAEELFVRDVYARLARYHFAAVEIRAAEQRRTPDDYLRLGVMQVITAPGEPKEAEMPQISEEVALTRRALCHAGDPCHVYYDVDWPPPSRRTSASNAAPSPTWPGVVTHHSRYQVSLRLHGRAHVYEGLVLYHDVSGTGDVAPEILDPMIPSVNGMAGEYSPLPQAPWQEYLHSERYKRTIKEAILFKNGRAGGSTSVRPIGYLPGDETSPAQMVFSSGVPCGESLTISIRADNTELRPNGTGAPEATTIYVTTEPPTPGVSIFLELSVAEANSGGHADSAHGANRPLGTLGTTLGTTNSSGSFYTSYVAPRFGGRVTITANAGGTPASLTLPVQVSGLVELGSGAYYELTGATSAHPEGTNHWGTATAIANLPLIAGAYRAQYPTAASFRFNDMSLPMGGKFDLAALWSGSGSHDEHRLGTNCDVGASGIPLSRHSAILQIFALYSAGPTGDETSIPDVAPHWHLRF